MQQYLIASSHWDGNGVDGVGVWREGMLYLTNTLSGVGALYQTAFYGLPSDVAVVGVWRALSADQLLPPCNLGRQSI